MERFCIKRLSEICGFKVETADGIFVPGGTYANITGLAVARHKYFPHVREEGFRPEDQPVIFTSVQCHYSVTRGAMLCGIGMKNCIKIKANKSGEMDPEDLEK